MRKLLHPRFHPDAVMVGWNRWAARHRDVVFVQIGSHDGHQGDPLVRWIDRWPKWRGVMVEPIPGLFAKLVERRGSNPRIRLVNAAVTTHSGTVDMMTVDPQPGMPTWASELSSINPAVTLKHEASVPGLRDATRNITVPAITFAALTAGMDRIDVVHIDTEGHDAAILDQVDLEVPRVIMFEHLHLSPDELERCSQRLEGAGFRVARGVADVFAH